MSARIRRPVLRYFGGKWRLAPWVISFFPEHELYVEPFGGGASVLIRKPRAKVAEVYNDLDAEVVNVFRVLQSRSSSSELARLLSLTPFSRDEYDLAHNKECECPIERARRTIIQSFFGHGASSLTDRTKSGFRSGGLSANRIPSLDWLNYPREIEKFCERMQGVIIENSCAFKVIERYDRPGALFYVDPPYILESKKHRYRFGMNELGHQKLINLLSDVRGLVILSGYSHPIYERLGWHRMEIEAFADGARPRMECLWLNPAAHAAQAQMEMKV